jgi:hypothetical protein
MYCIRNSYFNTYSKDITSIWLEHGFYFGAYSLGIRIYSQSYHALTYTENSKIVVSNHDLQEILISSVFNRDTLITADHIEYYKPKLYDLISEYSIKKFINNPGEAREFLLTKFAEMHNPFQYYLNKLREKNDC